MAEIKKSLFNEMSEIFEYANEFRYIIHPPVECIYQFGQSPKRIDPKAEVGVFSRGEFEILKERIRLGIIKLV